MVTERVTDGRRIAQLLAAELRGRTDGPLGRVALVDVRDAEGTPDGTFAYGIAVEDGAGGAGAAAGGGPRRLADVYVHDRRARVEFREHPEAAVRAGERAGLRVRPVAGEPPRTLIFVESGVGAKRAADAVADLVADAQPDDPAGAPGEAGGAGPDTEANR